MAEITNDAGDKLIVHPEGGKIELWLGGTLVLGSFPRGDGKQGTTHPCTPIFGPDRNNLYGLKQHGMMRNDAVSVKEENGEIVVSYAIKDEGYPAGMNVEQRMSLRDKKFHFAMTHTNTGEKEAAVNAGEHCYFDAPQGFKGTTINGKDISALIEQNVDGVAVPLVQANTIQIPGKPAIDLMQIDLMNAMVWVGKHPETKAIDQTYICIEPVEEDPNSDFFGSPESMLKPGERRTCTFTISI